MRRIIAIASLVCLLLSCSSFTFADTSKIADVTVKAANENVSASISESVSASDQPVQLSTKELKNLKTYMKANSIDKGIMDAVQAYYNMEGESQVSGENAVYSTVVSDADLIEYASTRDAAKTEWNKKLGHEVNQYNVSVNYRNVTIKANTAVVELEKNWEMVLDGDYDNVARASGENHLLKMKNISGKWFIEKDVFNEGGKPATSDLDSTKYTKEKTEGIKTFIENIDENITDYKSIVSQSNLDQAAESMSVAALSSQVYDRSAATSYANRYSQSNNSNYPVFSNDCTNYVSQCIFMGASVQNVSRNWYCYQDPRLMTFSYGRNWTLVTGLNSFLTSNSSYQALTGALSAKAAVQAEM